MFKNNSPKTSMPVQKEPYLYITQSSSDGLSSASLLATAMTATRPDSLTVLFPSGHNQTEQLVTFSYMNAYSKNI